MKGKLKNIVTSILTWEAKRVLKKFKPKVVAVTGSVGKTGTKDAVYTALSNIELTRKSEKSFNSEIGVPLTILGLPNAWNSVIGWIENLGEGWLLPWRRNEGYPDWLVLEVGVDRPGDIERMSWLKPHIAIFTQFPKVPVHVEYFSSPEEVANEKRKLKEALSEDGTLIVNADDEKMHGEEVREGQNKLSYGYSDHATVKGSDYRVDYEEGKPVGVSFKVQFQEKMEEVHLRGVIGRHHTYPALTALTVIVAEGRIFARAVQSFTEHLPAPGRMRLLQGVNNSVIIDDTYNSSPVAVQAGLEALTTLQVRGKRIVILGDMLELGEFSVKEHQALGEVIATSADVFISVGVRMLAAAESAIASNARCKHIESFQTGIEALPVIKKMVEEGDVVFIKGSQGMRMERIVENLLHDPHTAVNVLCRQDPHWKVRA